MFQTKLYSQLMTLVAQSKQENRPTFIHKDVQSIYDQNVVYRIFDYNLPKFSDFKQEGALSSRGTMFAVDKTTQEATLVAYTMDKFFTYGENPDTMKIQYTDIVEAMVKVDGSLISSYIALNPNEPLGLKSKTEPIFSDFESALNFLKSRGGLYEEVLNLTSQSYTINFEYTSPTTRVIVDYSEVSMKILNVRSLKDGSYLDIRSKEFSKKYTSMSKILVGLLQLNLFTDLKNSDFSKMRDIEGAVLKLKDGTLVKYKTEWYNSQHDYVSIQDFSKASEKLFHVILNGCADELRSLLTYRAKSPRFNLEKKLDLISKTEDAIQKALGEFEAEYSFVEENKHLDKSAFVELAKSKFNDNNKIGIAVGLFAGKYKDLNAAFASVYAKKIKVPVDF